MRPFFFFIGTIPLLAQVHVDLGTSILVAEGPAEEHRWGLWQFPGSIRRDR